MGGRGNFLRSGSKGISLEEREWQSIGRLDGIKLIVNTNEEKKNAAQPTYSNTANTKYFTVSGNSGKIKQISYYKNHEIYRSVDIDMSGRGKHHAHIWDKGKGARVSHDPSHKVPLSAWDRHYLKKALEYNQKHKKR